MIFTRADSRQAARAFLQWLKSRKGRCTKVEMSAFAYELAAGKRGPKFSRTNFYAGILRRFVELGFVAERPEYDYERRRTVTVYRALIQPVPKHRPVAPSVTYLAHVLAELWNNEFTEENTINRLPDGD